MKSIIKTMTNNDIYNLALGLINAKFEESDIYIPAAINFAIQKNKMADYLVLLLLDEVEYTLDLLKSCGYDITDEQLIK